MRTGTRLETLTKMRVAAVKRGQLAQKRHAKARADWALCCDEIEIIDRLITEEKKCLSK